MRFTCACGEKEISIPDEKLPAAKRFAIKCPFCQKKLVVDRDGDKAKASFADQPAQARPEPRKPVLKLPTIEPEVFPPGSKVAFIDVRDAAWRSAAEAFLAERGYNISVSEEPLEAVAKMRLNHYDVLMVEDSEESRLLLDEVASWPGRRRRALNYVLVGDAGRSLHPDVAFERGVNFYLNKADVAKAKELLASALDGYDLYYQLFTLAQKRINE